MEATITHAKGVGIIFAIDSKTRSTSWHDVLTNKRGKIMEEFLLSKQLHIVDEESCCTTFWSSHGASNINLTVTNNQALVIIDDWATDDFLFLRDLMTSITSFSVTGISFISEVLSA